MIVWDDVLRVWIEDDAVWVELCDGRKAKARFADYPHLNGATMDQRKNFSVSRCGIHWPDIDEDLSFEGIFSACRD